MEVTTMITMTRNEVNSTIPYQMICETRFGHAWETGRRRRAWLDTFNEQERDACSRLFKQAHSWYLVKGVPDSVTMSSRTLALWLRLAEFCGNI